MFELHTCRYNRLSTALMSCLNLILNGEKYEVLRINIVEKHLTRRVVTNTTRKNPTSSASFPPTSSAGPSATAKALQLSV